LCDRCTPGGFATQGQTFGGNCDPTPTRRIGAPTLTEYRCFVPDFSGGLRRSESWTTTGSPKVVLAAIVAAVEQRGGRTEDIGETEADLLMGSRTAYRLLGMVSPVKTRPIRLHVVATAESPDTVRVAADATSDVGWYMVNATFLSSKQFKRAFDDLFDAVRLAVPATSG
jgi:hypothetical protein